MFRGINNICIVSRGAVPGAPDKAFETSGPGRQFRGTGIVGASLTVGAIAADIWLHGQRRLSLGLVLAFIVGFAAGWAILGQPTSQIPAFLTGGLWIAGGYNWAIRLQPSPTSLSGGLLTLLVFGLATRPNQMPGNE